MNAHCRFEDRARWHAVERLLAKYGKNVPRYTSYPTAPHFNADVAAGAYRSWLAELDDRKPVSLYLHIPFCARLCSYCGCHTTVVHSHSPIADYVGLLLEEIGLVSRAIGASLPVAAVHLGGGTPNCLAPADVDHLFAALGRAFEFNAKAEIAAELDPRVLTEDWIMAARRNGLNRASLGVQDVNPQVQRAINRDQPWRVTLWAVEALRKAGIGSINLDLMYGLPFQTIASIQETVTCALEVEPDRIALFGYAHVPWMKANQRLIDQAALPDAVQRYFQQEAAAEILIDSGYVRIGLDHFARRSDPLAKALAAGGVKRNFQGYTTDSAETLLGFGASAIGRLPSGYVQNATRTPDWRVAIQSGRLATSRGLELKQDDRLRGEIIGSLMCDLAVDLHDVAMRYDAPMDLFSLEALPGLRDFIGDGLASLDAGRLVVSESGRPFVRTICALFDRHFENGAERHSTAI
jgi:oxygen-independent coproporphyrinogen-3 oxidase